MTKRKTIQGRAIYHIVNTKTRFIADNEADFVEQLAKVSFTQTHDLLQWMQETGDRINLFIGKRIRCWNPELFVEDLVAEGLITVELLQ